MVMFHCHVSFQGESIYQHYLDLRPFDADEKSSKEFSQMVGHDGDESHGTFSAKNHLNNKSKQRAPQIKSHATENTATPAIHLVLQGLITGIDAVHVSINAVPRKHPTYTYARYCRLTSHLW